MRSGRLPEAVVDASARRVAALGRYARPSDRNPVLGQEEIEAGHTLARQVAADCAVLLRNEHAVLPIAQTSRVAVIGEFAVLPSYQGGGSSHINPTLPDTALDTIRSHAEWAVDFAPGYHRDGSGDVAQLRAEAVKIAATADVAVVFAGIVRESEGFDREHIDLPADQVELIRAVAAAALRTVVVLSNGGVVSLEGWHDEVDAILEGWLLGQAGGSALADLLYGVVNPSGHLAETIPLRLQDTPAYLNFPGEHGHVRYGEGVMVGYRHYVTAERDVRYPFGHGLSYTTFTTTDLTVTVTGPDTAQLTVTVANTGSRSGKHVVQVYMATNAGPVRRPTRELRAFEKVELSPGETRAITLDLDRRAFAYWDVRESRWVVASGDYTVQIGHSVTDIVAEQVVTLAGESLVAKLSMQSTVGDWFDHPVVGAQFTELLYSVMVSPESDQSDHAEDGMKMARGMTLHQFAGFLPAALPADRLNELIKLSEAPRFVRTS